MFRKIAALIVIAVVLAVFGTAFGMNKAEKSGNKGPAMAGKVTAVKGNTIIVRDGKGIERQFQLSSAAGVKVGQNAWCEEDCGKGMRIGEKNVQVKSFR